MFVEGWGKFIIVYFQIVGVFSFSIRAYDRIWSGWLNFVQRVLLFGLPCSWFNNLKIVTFVWNMWVFVVEVHTSNFFGLVLNVFVCYQGRREQWIRICLIMRRWGGIFWMLTSSKLGHIQSQNWEVSFTLLSMYISVAKLLVSSSVMLMLEMHLSAMFLLILL